MPGMMGGKKNGPPDPARMSEDILNHLSTQLSLTDDEKTKIKPIVEAQVAEIQKQMEAQRLAMQKQFEDTKAKIKPLLTADQQKQLDAMPLPGPKPPAPNGGQPPQPPDPMPGQ
jgi:ABC-type phosphate transport system auxiliary subunit